MVKNMIKNTNSKTKCASLDSCDDYRLKLDNLSNPYCYNFGALERNNSPVNVKKIQNKVNTEYFYKK